MLTALFAFLKVILPTILYATWVFVTIYSVFKNVYWGLFLIVSLIPQPNVYYQFYVFPMGKDMLDISAFCVLLGIIVQRKGLQTKGSVPIVFFYLLLSYFSVWIASNEFSMPLPITMANPLLIQWKEYAAMIFLYFLSLHVFKEEKEHRQIIVLISLVILFIGIRGFRSFTAGGSFSEDSRYEGPFWREGLGSNHYGAFMAHYTAAVLGFFFFEKDKRLSILYAMTLFFGTYAILFSYSRGAYLATLVVIMFYGFIHKRSLLILVCVFIFSWTVLLPTSVVERVQMTKNESGEIESSAQQRIDLWHQATDLFLEYPIFGVGYSGFNIKMKSIQNHLTDTHNYYLKVLCEEGLVGFMLLCGLLLRALWQGWKLFKIGSNSFYRGLGLGFLGATLSIMITNGFGDRWSYYVLGGYFWILLGIVDQGIINSESKNIIRAGDELALETPQ